MVKAHQIRLYPTIKQEIYFKKSCGVARYSYNWALTKWQEIYESGGNPTAYALIKLQNSIKRDETPFFMEVGKCAPQYAIHNLERGFKLFFKKHCKYPRFKNKRSRKQSFVAVENDKDFKQENYKIKIPKIGFVKCAENIRFEGKLNNVTIKKIADKWFAVVNISVNEIDVPIINENQVFIGIDVGIKTMITLSDGTKYLNSNPLKINFKKLKRLQRQLARKKFESKNYIKNRLKTMRLNYRISCIRKDAINKVTTEIVNKYDKIVIEDLDIQGLMKSHRMALLLSDVSFGEIFRQIKYKSKWKNKEVIIADMFYPSSKTCSNCNIVNKNILLKHRIFNCNNCGFSIERDLNAAKNLANYGSTLKLRESYASGVESSLKETLISSTKKEEVDYNHKLVHDAGNFNVINN